MSDGGELQEGELSGALRRWKIGQLESPEDEQIVLALYRMCILVARDLATSFAGDSGRQDDAEDLAHDFLTAVREGEDVGLIRSRAGLKKVMRRFQMRRANPAAHELWKIVSAALRALAEEGAARRLDEDLKKNNENCTRWILNEPGVPQAAADVVDLGKAVQTLRVQPPKGAHERNPAKNWRVLAPEEARKLVLEMLKLACGWVTMANLHRLTCSKVLLFRCESPDNDDWWKNVAEHHEPLAVERLLRLAGTLARKTWDAIVGEALTVIFCGYLLPKELRGQAVRLEDFGATSTAGDKAKKAKVLLLRSLDPGTKLEGMDVEWQSRVIREALAILETFCTDCSGKSGT